MSLLSVVSEIFENDRFVDLLQKYFCFNPLSANLTKWPNTLKQFVGNLPTNCLSVFGHFVNLALKRLNSNMVLGLLVRL